MKSFENILFLSFYSKFDVVIEKNRNFEIPSSTDAHFTGDPFLHGLENRVENPENLEISK